MRDNKVIKVPELSLIVLMGASGSGKSTFARKLFKETEIVSSDKCRGLVSNDENNQAASARRICACKAHNFTPPEKWSSDRY